MSAVTAAIMAAPLPREGFARGDPMVQARRSAVEERRRQRSQERLQSGQGDRGADCGDEERGGDREDP